MQERMTGQEIEENTLINRWVGEYLKEKKKREQLKKECDSYRKALEEIKKVIIPLANKNPIDNCWALLNRCDECASKKDCKTQSPYFRAKQMLDIISRAKEESQ